MIISEQIRGLIDPFGPTTIRHCVGPLSVLFIEMNQFDRLLEVVFPRKRTSRIVLP